MRERIWTPGFTALTISNTLSSLGVHMLMPIIPLYLVALGASKTQVGFVVTGFFLASIITRLLVNVVTMRFGKKPTLLVGVLFTGIVVALCGLTESVGAAAVLRSAQGIGFGVMTTLYTTFAADLLPDSRRGEGVGYFGMGVVLAMVVAPVLSIYLKDTYSFSTMFYVAACFPFISVIGMHFFKAPSELKQESRNAADKEPFWRNIYDPKLSFQAVLLIILGVCRSADANFIALFAQERKLEYISFYFVIQTTASFFARFAMGRLSDKKGRNWTLIPGGCAALISLLILTVANSSALLLSAGVFSGISIGVLVPGMQLWLFSIVAPEKRNVASATYFNFYDIGVSLGAIMLGYLAENAGYSLMFLSAAVFASVYLICYIVAGMEKRDKTNSNATQLKGAKK